MKDYDIGAAFDAVERELISSMLRNLKRHRVEEITEKKEWAMWQAEQLKALEFYRKENKKRFSGGFTAMQDSIGALLRESKKMGGMNQEKKILEAIENGFRGYRRAGNAVQAQFFKTNSRKLNALIKATAADMRKTETAILRMADDQYRKIIYNAQVYANTGAGTYERAVDMATRDMLASGLNCVEYANGARHRLSDYAAMALRTASKRAYLAGEGEKRREWGVSTVIINKRGNPCPRCLPFVGKVFIDDVWSGGKKSDGPYPLLSSAIVAGLYHPNCKDSHSTFFAGINTESKPWTREEIRRIERTNHREADRQHAERQAEKFGRLSTYSIDAENKKKYRLKAGEWRDKAKSEARALDILKAHDRFVGKLREDPEPNRHKAMMALYSETANMVEDSNISAPFVYSAFDDTIRYNPKAPSIENYDLDFVFAHETSHRMDVLEYHSWENERFLQAIEICSQKVYDKKDEIQAWFEPGGTYENSFALSDMISALTSGEIAGMVAHSREYWRKPGFKAIELFANISAGDVLGLPEKETFADVFEELFAAYEEMIR